MNFGDSVQIKGCSLKSRHLESSSGNSSIDALLGGGIPNTSIVILDETESRAYADVLLKYFIAEGLYNDHDILFADPCGSKPGNSDFWTSIPTKATDSNGGETAQRSLPQSDAQMKIAFRYGSTPQVNSSIGSKSRYDLRNTITDFTPFGSTRETDNSSSYAELLKKIHAKLESDRYSRARAPKKNLLRVVIRNLGSPVWTDSDLCSRFMAKLQSLARDGYIIVMASTCSTNLTPILSRELEVSSDVYFRLVAMSEEDKAALPSLDKFHGYFYIVRLPRLTSISTFCPPASDLVFELHRKSFDVKVLHLPPALGPDDAPKKSACNVDF